MAFFIVVALAILLLMFLLAIATLVIISKRGDVVLLKKLPGYKPHLLYGNALEMAREPDSKYISLYHMYFASNLLTSYIRSYRGIGPE